MPEFTVQDVAVVIPTRDRWPILRRMLSALGDQSVRGFETIVVVDGEDQRHPELGPVRVLVVKHGGPGAARNAGVKATDRRIVLFLGDDMIPVPTLVERHLASHERNPELETGVLGRVDLHPDVRGNRLNQWMEWSGSQFDYRNITGDDAGWGRFYSSNVSLKRGFFESSGGFDEDFVYYYEDLDFGWRLHQKGLRLVYARDAVAHHLHPLRWSDVVRRFQGVARGERLMDAKHAWFEPYFAKCLQRASGGGRISRIWPLVVERVPDVARLRSFAERKADAWYCRRIASYFLDAWEGARDLEELHAYLGEHFDQTRLEDHMGEVRRELGSMGDEDAFYRSSEAYLYDLTVFAMSGTKVPYLHELRRLIPRGARLLDWGCGVGSDGLRLLDAGYIVAFADFDNPSTRYLRWRLQRRGLEAAVYDIDSDDVPSGFDAAYAFDVIEHVDDPFGFLNELEQRAAIVIVNLLEDEPDSLHPHRSLPIPRIVEHATSRGLLAYRVFHRRSHLVAYRGTDPPKPTDRLRSSFQRRLGPLVPALRGDEGPTTFVPGSLKS